MTGMVKKRILIIEDNVFLLSALQKSLQEKQYEVKIAQNIDRAMILIQERSFEAIVCDRLLGVEDSLEFIALCTQLLPMTKILILSQKAQVQDRIDGLRSGAADYLPKPFSTEELMLRLENLIGKTVSCRNKRYEFGKLKLYPDLGCVCIKQKKIQLSWVENKILSCLFRYQYTVVTRDSLIDEIWNFTEEVPDFRSISVYIRRLRVKLGKYGSYVKTVRGFGYKLSDP